MRSSKLIQKTKQPVSASSLDIKKKTTIMPNDKKSKAAVKKNILKFFILIFLRKNWQKILQKTKI